MPNLTINGEPLELTDLDPRTPLLWVLRDTLGLTGTKYGCGIAQCGACTVHVGGTAMRSCSIAIGSLEGREVTTIEGLSPDGSHPVQKAWAQLNVPQCGYCQTGQIMSAAALIASNPEPDDDAIDSFMGGNICRCGTYTRIRAAILSAAQEAKQ